MTATQLLRLPGTALRMGDMLSPLGRPHRGVKFTGSCVRARPGNVLNALAMRTWASANAPMPRAQRPPFGQHPGEAQQPALRRGGLGLRLEAGCGRVVGGVRALRGALTPETGISCRGLPCLRLVLCPGSPQCTRFVSLPLRSAPRPRLPCSP